ncbi:MAG: hypothetical protein QW680_05100 [Pyrobaculum sp.]
MSRVNRPKTVYWNLILQSPALFALLRGLCPSALKVDVFEVIENRRFAVNIAF